MCFRIFKRIVICNDIIDMFEYHDIHMSDLVLKWTFRKTNVKQSIC